MFQNNRWHKMFYKVLIKYEEPRMRNRNIFK